jgi:hypothetical protein
MGQLWLTAWLKSLKKNGNFYLGKVVNDSLVDFHARLSQPKFLMKSDSRPGLILLLAILIGSNAGLVGWGVASLVIDPQNSSTRYAVTGFYQTLYP